MLNEISVCIPISCASFKLSTAPAGNWNVMAIQTGSVVKGRSETLVDLLFLFECPSKRVKVCLADVTIRDIVKTRRGFSGSALTSALTSSWLLQSRKHNQHDSHRNDCDAQLNGSIHF